MRQAHASVDYHLGDESGRPRGENPALRGRVELHEGSLRLVQDDAPMLDLSLAGIRRGAVITTVPAPTAAPRLEGNRAEIHRSAGLEEWFVNGPAGVEQGFTLATPPLKGEAGELVLELRVAGGLVPSIVEGAVALRSSDQRTTLWYTGLFAEDTDGRELASWMDVDGQTIQIHIEDRDAAYPIQIDPVVTETAKLVAANPAVGTGLGASVSIDGDTAVVGAQNEAAYVFARSGGVWSQQAKLVSGVPNSAFGRTVAIRKDTILVGDYYVGAGAVYVFGRSGSLWTQQSVLLASDGVAGDYFGASVALSPDGTTAVVGATNPNLGTGFGPGAAYVFVQSGGVWTQQAKLMAMQPSYNDNFGAAVAIDGDTLVVGQTDPVSELIQGTAQVFVRNGSTWTQEAKLSSTPGGELPDAFGASVSVSGDTLAIGAPDDDYDSSTFNSGAVYVFQRSAGVWTKQVKLQGNAYLGHFSRVALAGEVLVVGEYFGANNGNVPPGNAYLYVRSGATWNLQANLIPSGGMPYDGFGESVSISGGAAIIGAPVTHAPNYFGAAYIYKVPAPNGSPCAGASDCIGQTCVDGLCCDTACGGGVLDCQACNLPGSLGTCTITSAGTACRPVAGACDVAESCDGTSPTCPQDTFVAAATPCRPAMGQCDVVEVCSGAAAACPADAFLSNGTSCDDSNACTLGDACQNGSCKSGLAVTCPALDQCHDAGTCDVGTGQCSVPAKADGSGCEDGNLCTKADTCQAGACVAGAPLVCAAPDQCHQAGTCDPATGVCSNPARPDASACDDGNGCTMTDTCVAGACVGANKVVCTPLDACHVAGFCTAATGQCKNPTKPDGATCPGGVCEGGVCLSNTGSSTGIGGAGGASATTGPGETSSSGGSVGTSSPSSTSGAGESAAGGCGCRLSEAPPGGGWILGLGVLLASARRRERRAVRRRPAT